ncbi:hypothetical protein B0H17DRAFT_1148121 [Mycena rosella]|uniref:CCHC-type domain-containing protein n=1 Tax=Mycena rosella TaxID=1033263 RepID=A0AAD7CGU5_MYCRO|nr:hypothetical protein B0H17DRAFT_1148121 [Mycena rosella]
MSESNSAYLIKQLEGAQGYSAWATKMIDILTDQDMDDYVTGIKTRAPVARDEADASEIAALADWRKKQRKALSAIRLGVAEGPMAYIQNATTAVNAWKSEDIIARILQQAGRPHAKPDADDMALPAFGGKGRGGKHTQSSPRNDGCFHCGRPGHHSHECRDKKNGKTYTEDEKRRNYERTSRNKKQSGGGSSKANVAEEQADSDIVFMAGERRALTKDSWLLDNAAAPVHPGCGSAVVYLLLTTPHSAWAAVWHSQILIYLPIRLSSSQHILIAFTDQHPPFRVLPASESLALAQHVFETHLEL